MDGELVVPRPWFTGKGLSRGIDERFKKSTPCETKAFGTIIVQEKDTVICIKGGSIKETHSQGQ